MTTCVNIIVNIQDYDPAITFRAYVRPYGSIIDFNSYPQYTKLATSSQVVFNGLDPLQFEVGVQKDCGNGNLSEIVWQDPITTSCSPCTAVFATTKFVVGVPAGKGFEWRMDSGSWNKVAGVTGSSSIDLTLAAINGATSNYEANNPNSLIDFQFRTFCSTTERSSIYHYYRIVTPTALGKISLVKTLCSGSTYVGQLLRLTIGSENTSPEKLVYHDPSGDQIITSYTRTGNKDVDIAYYMNVMNGTNLLRTFDPATPQIALTTSFDFISHESPYGGNYTGTVNCGPYPVKHEIIAG